MRIIVISPSLIAVKCRVIAGRLSLAADLSERRRKMQNRANLDQLQTALVVKNGDFTTPNPLII